MSICLGLKGTDFIITRIVQICVTINKSHRWQKMTKNRKEGKRKPSLEEQESYATWNISPSKGNGWETMQEKYGNTEMIEWWLQEQGKFT